VLILSLAILRMSINRYQQRERGVVVCCSKNELRWCVCGAFA